MNDHASKLKGFVWILAACAIGASFALGLSPLAHAIPWSWEMKLGAMLEWNQANRECGYHPRAEALLGQLVKRIYPLQAEDQNFSIDVMLVKEPAINAYATLGGKIYINSGLLQQAKSPEEVAGVLAHEIGHVHHRHIMQGTITRLFTSQGFSTLFDESSSAANWANYFMVMDFSRSQEAEADEDGLKRLQEAHVDNRGFKSFFERMEQQENSPAFLSDHPPSRSRIDMAKRFSNQNPTPIMSQAEWEVLKNSCGQQLKFSRD